mgnify:CR=1 FL=1
MLNQAWRREGGNKDYPVLFLPLVQIFTYLVYNIGKMRITNDLYGGQGGKLMRTYAKKMHGLVLAAAIAVAMGVCLVPATPAAAFGLGDLGNVIAAGQAYAQQEKALNYFNNEGRYKYMDEVKKTYGVNNDYTANAMLENIMGRLSTSIAAVDPSIKKKPYNYFVNNEKSFNAFCTLEIGRAHV